ncbi:hypothetical protein SAMN05216420_11391 [Nitrosospira sp. Nl5]|uniref:sensory rhodopsin transducer n=1 Tax=Nitrosospira sp. Nl5 TaxID=200120 RepID=UPI0008891D72|nr:sensory rhodopsin transducer [Nitrosospira sp. Nl5]SCY70264.1 hypothetical protein SAMN05216420_11391 [Nitrosospira sp. Nl5]
MVKWVIPGGRIPLTSTGAEPEFTSRDRLSFLNTGPEDVDLKITVLYEDQEPVGPYEISVSSRRMRAVRTNDFINPEALFLDVPYSVVIEAPEGVIIQFTRQDTSQEALTLAGGIGYSEE